MSDRPAIADDPLRHLEADLAELDRQSLLRRPSDPRGSGLIELCSNDYLGYASDPWPVVNACSGAGASRLVTGNCAEHAAAETALADWLRSEAALLFTSGYAANVGTLSSLARPGDVIVSDRLNHASIIDGCRLSGAKVLVVEHCDLAAAERALRGASSARRRWMVSESYFSMDGDSPDLAGLRRVCTSTDTALIVDEAHALGVFGDEGRGLCAASGVRPDVLIGTAGKALGLHGAFVVGSAALKLWLWNRARSFVFSTGVNPALAEAIGQRADLVRSDDEGRRRLTKVGRRLREALGQGRGEGPIIPYVVGEASAALGLSARLRERAVLVQAIRPPTVPAGTARLRLTANSRLSDAALETAVEALHATCREGGS